MKLKRVLIGTLLSFVLVASFFGFGLMTHSIFREKALAETSRVLKEHFALRKEVVRKFDSPDYSLGLVEMPVMTESAEYYTALSVKNPWWIQFSILNILINPDVQVASIERERASEPATKK